MELVELLVECIVERLKFDYFNIAKFEKNCWVPVSVNLQFHWGWVLKNCFHWGLKSGLKFWPGEPNSDWGEEIFRCFYTRVCLTLLMSGFYRVEKPWGALFQRTPYEILTVSQNHLKFSGVILVYSTKWHSYFCFFSNAFSHRKRWHDSWCKNGVIRLFPRQPYR